GKIKRRGKTGDHEFDLPALVLPAQKPNKLLLIVGALEARYVEILTVDFNVLRNGGREYRADASIHQDAPRPAPGIVIRVKRHDHPRLLRRISPRTATWEQSCQKDEQQPQHMEAPFRAPSLQVLRHGVRPLL